MWVSERLRSPSRERRQRPFKRPSSHPARKPSAWPLKPLGPLWPSSLRIKPVLNRLPLLLVCLCLASCGSISVERPRPAPSLLVPCAEPVRLPERGLSDQEVEIFWGRDRDALRSCASKISGLIEWEK